MHDAPSVSYPVGRSRWGAALLALAWLAGVAAVLAWSLQPQVAAWRLAAAWSAVIGAGALALRQYRRAPAGILAWDGASWSWSEGSGPAASGRLRLSLDLQQILLVHWRGDRGSRWIWLERASRRERWDDLRRAVYSRARPEALSVGEPPAAKP
ncbi:hypothetical protein [Ramlibacter sp.]|uniref:hypothetical protein n=1 Tax=Ramlibacter sp. TaxID=1917967 RepID=UPI002C2DF065|nr:hypothetical protein [Ramlibacter sp.]HWI80691.1 hypothetical protein [Ramlibacter sp.]